jgi:L-fucose mutarotase/ribose pyranase (RbsD/FucU family)
MALTNPSILEQLAGTSRIHKWLEDPGFAQWWWDEHSVADELMALRYKAVSKLAKIIDGDNVNHSDVLKAVRMIFEVTDQFPSKKQEVRFLDKEIDGMSESQVDQETKALAAKLGENE